MKAEDVVLSFEEVEFFSVSGKKGQPTAWLKAQIRW